MLHISFNARNELHKNWSKTTDRILNFLLKKNTYRFQTSKWIQITESLKLRVLSASHCSTLVVSHKNRNFPIRRPSKLQNHKLNSNWFKTRKVRLRNQSQNQIAWELANHLQRQSIWPSGTWKQLKTEQNTQNTTTSAINPTESMYWFANLWKTQQKLHVTPLRLASINSSENQEKKIYLYKQFDSRREKIWWRSMNSETEEYSGGAVECRRSPVRGKGASYATERRRICWKEFWSGLQWWANGLILGPKMTHLVTIGLLSISGSGPARQ